MKVRVIKSCQFSLSLFNPWLYEVVLFILSNKRASYVVCPIRLFSRDFFPKNDLTQLFGLWKEHCLVARSTVLEHEKPEYKM